MVSLKQGKLSKRFQPQDWGSTNFMFIPTLFKIDLAFYALYYDGLHFYEERIVWYCLNGSTWKNQRQSVPILNTKCRMQKERLHNGKAKQE